MKTQIKNQYRILFPFLLFIALISCSKDDGSESESTLDITRYAIGGKLTNDRLGVLTFDGDGVARLRDVDLEKTYNYSVENNVVVIETVGAFKIENDQIIDAEVNFDFSDATLFTLPDQNALLNTGYAGVIGNSVISESFFAIFSSQEAFFGFGSTAILADPNKSFIMLNTISGYYQSTGINDIFFLKNGKLVYERKVTISGFPTSYFYASGLDRIP